MNDIISSPGIKRDRWNKLLSNRVELGEPYVLFTDNANKNCPSQYQGRIQHSNLCVAPETLVLTDSGYVEISSLEGKKVNVWNGQEFSNVEVHKTGKDQKLIKVECDDGQYIECTPYHKFYIQNGYNSSDIKVKRASELLQGDKILKSKMPVIEGDKYLDYKLS